MPSVRTLAVLIAVAALAMPVSGCGARSGAVAGPYVGGTGGGSVGD